MAQINQTQKVKLMMQTKKIPNIHGLAEKVDYDAKLTDIKQNIQYQWLKYYVALTAVENKIPMLLIQSKKQIMTQKYQALNLNVLLQLIVINLLMVLLLIR